jgi:hypothetical protein
LSAVLRWPDVGVALWAELERTPGRFALVTGGNLDEAVAALADLRGTIPFHVGRDLTQCDSKPSEATVRARLRGKPLLVGTEILFDSVLGVDPVRLLAGLAREHPPLVATWPTFTTHDRLAYPPGIRRDGNTAQELQGCLLLAARPTLFADEAPFTIERFT